MTRHYEKSYISSSDNKLDISNNVYVWHASDNACEKCQSLDGKEFDNIDDIPQTSSELQVLYRNGNR